VYCGQRREEARVAEGAMHWLKGRDEMRVAPRRRRGASQSAQRILSDRMSTISSGEL
jgi:hypothetical protein